MQSKKMGALVLTVVLAGLMLSGVARVAGAMARAGEAAPLAAALDVAINEVGWGGTAASSYDEWIELYNNTDAAVDLTGWTLAAVDGTPTILLTGTVSAHGYYLLERADDNTVSDIAADQVYGTNGSDWALSNAGEALELRDGGGQVIDAANGDGGAWPEGSGSPDYCTMERIDPLAADDDANWCSNDGVTWNGRDANGNPLSGTARAENSCYQPPPVPEADLAVSKSGPTAVAPGSPITYHLAISNAGGAVAAGTVLTDLLPEGVGFASQSSPFSHTLVGQAVVWDVGDVPTDTGYAITLVGWVSDTASGTLVNVLTATTASTETVLGNNAAAWSTVVVVGHAPLDVAINEVAWMGTAASGYDEWIELLNNTDHPVDLAGWTLTAADGSPDISLSGVISPYSYFLLERTDDTTVSDVPADQIYSGDLVLGGEVLTLRDDLGVVIDTANGDGGEWPAGLNDPDHSMERIDPLAPDSDANWCSNDGLTCNGLDANGDPISGTVKMHNSCYQPPQADLAVTKSGTIQVRAGGVVTYVIALDNAGSALAAGVVLTDQLPGPVTFVTQSHSGGLVFEQPAPGLLVWRAGELDPQAGAAVWITGTVALGAEAGFTNTVTATTTSTETMLANNRAAWWTEVERDVVYLPIVAHDDAPPPYRVIVEAVLFDGVQSSEYDEAVLLRNGDDQGIDLSGWQLCDWDVSGGSCTDLPPVTIAAGQRLWLARNATSFAASFGFAPDFDLDGWPLYANAGDEVLLRNAHGVVMDVLVYEDGYTGVEGWDGEAVRLYGASEGAVVYRILDEATGVPAADSDTALDWALHDADPWQGRRYRYPGWDLEQFFMPALDAGGVITVGIAPDNACQVVVDTIRAAETSIEIELYTFTHHDLLQELVLKAQQGVSVTLLLEGGPAGGVADQELWACQQLHEAGGRCYFMVDVDALNIQQRYRSIHAKFIVVDRARLLVSSQNMTHSGLPSDDKGDGSGGSRGVVIVTDAPAIVARAAAVFAADCDPANHADITLWAPDNPYGYGLPPEGFVPVQQRNWITYTVQFPQPLVATGDGFELLTSPDSSLRQDDALLGLVARAGAGDAVYVQQMYEHADWGADPAGDPNLRLESYIDAARRGARVRILLNAGTFGNEYLPVTENVVTAAYVAAVAAEEGLDLEVELRDPTLYGVHNKMVLVDLGDEGRYAHLGSINGSETASKLNREMALQVRSDALFDYLYAMFDHDWQTASPLDHLLITEVLYNPSGYDTGLEWVEIYNPTAADIDLSTYRLGDVGPQGEYGSGLYWFPTGAVLPAGGVILVAQQAKDVSFTPDFEFLIDPNRNDPAVPDMVPAGSWEGFGFALGNEGDEVVLRMLDGTAVDAVVYGDGNYGGVIPHPGVVEGHSLERRPPELDTDDCSSDFVDRYPPTPGLLPE
ncbi:MAG: lamin tail domain-containing protein [Anaerolineae bacterium]|nr:lamin tail domain-containing protein [Anaerolineae bacterium]